MGSKGQANPAAARLTPLPVIGSELQGRRPVLVISDETTNTVMPVVTIVPVTALKKGRRLYPNEALLKKGIAGLDADSIVLAHQIWTISKQRLMLWFVAKSQTETGRSMD